MRMYDIITKKKHSEELTETEIRELVREYTVGNIPDYQMSSLLMAICLNGMSDEETLTLTDAISNSGDKIDLSEFGELSADKHSTGGVGDKTTLIVAPLAAALGLKVAKMSGRGLGHTGGTIDKLESINGYNTMLTPEQFKEQVRKIGISVVGQSGNLAPADKKLYALRDVSATVDSIPLITSSVMGKKLAAGSHTIVLDVKCGSGAFLKTKDEAEKLACAMVKIGNMSGRKTAALITNMDIPLGLAIGNNLEVKEAIGVLCGKVGGELYDISVALAATMAQLALNIPYEEAKIRAENALKSGEAFKKFKEWVGAQGADTSLIDNPELFSKSAYQKEVLADKTGYISKMDTEKIGLSAMELGAGRKTKEAPIDFTAGIILKRKPGDKVSEGEAIATLHTNKKESFDTAETLFKEAISYSDEKVLSDNLIYKTII